MKIKQQKQIKAFLEKEFGKTKGNSLLEEQKQILGILIENIKNKSKKQKKTLVQTILPGIAIYKALVQENIPEEEAYACMQKYMFGTVGENMHASMRKMELVPGFYTLYSHIFLKVMQDTDLQESVQSMAGIILMLRYTNVSGIQPVQKTVAPDCAVCFAIRTT